MLYFILAPPRAPFQRRKCSLLSFVSDDGGTSELDIHPDGTFVSELFFLHHMFPLITTSLRKCWLGNSSIQPFNGFLETFCPGIRNIGFTEFACYLHLLNSVIYHWVGNFRTFLFPVKANYTFRTSGEGVEEALIVQFGIKWMKATTDALQDKKEEDEDPSQVTNMFLNSDRTLYDTSPQQGNLLRF